MSEEVKSSADTEATAAAASSGATLDGLYGFKVGMSAVFNEQGERIPVTVVKYENMAVSQIKTQSKEGYSAVQLAFVPDRASQSNSAVTEKFKPAGFENGAKFVREIRLAADSTLSVGQKISIESLKKGDVLKVSGLSRGRGFQGAVRRWNFHGGPASHGSGFHRKPGSVGNRTWPGRVMPGKRMAGHYGNETITIKNIEIVDVIPEENVLLLKGSVPGARNTLLCLTKV